MIFNAKLMKSRLWLCYCTIYFVYKYYCFFSSLFELHSSLTCVLFLYSVRVFMWLCLCICAQYIRYTRFSVCMWPFHMYLREFFLRISCFIRNQREVDYISFVIWIKCIASIEKRLVKVQSLLIWTWRIEFNSKNLFTKKEGFSGKIRIFQCDVHAFRVETAHIFTASSIFMLIIASHVWKIHSWHMIVWMSN